MKNFREMMVSDFFAQCPPERRPSSSQSNRQHHLQYRIAQEKKIRRPCAGCYQKLRAQNIHCNDAKKKLNFVFTYCDQCPKKPQLCLDCFHRLHQAYLVSLAVVVVVGVLQYLTEGVDCPQLQNCCCFYVYKIQVKKCSKH